MTDRADNQAETTIRTVTDTALASVRQLEPRSIAIGLATALLVGASALAGQGGMSEGRFLAVLSVAVLGLTTPAAIGGERWRLHTWYAAALMTAAAALALPVGPVRGTATSCALVLALASTVPVHNRRPLELTLVPSAIAVQLVLRSSTLLASEVSVSTLVVWVGLPAASAVAAWLALGQREPRLVAAALVCLVLACGGFTVTSTLALWVAVLATHVSKPKRISVWVPGTALAACVGVGALWHWPTGLLLAALAVLLISRGLGFAVLLVVAGTLAQLTEPRAWDAVASEAPRILILLPFAAATWALDIRSRSLLRDLRRLSGVALLTIVALRSLVPEAALAIPVLLVLMSDLQPARGSRNKKAARAAGVYQTLWAGSLLAIAAVGASYPWLRWPDFGRLLSLTGWESASALWIAGGAAATLALLVTLGSTATRFQGSQWAAPSVVGLSLILLATTLQRPSTPIHDWPPVTLSAAQPIGEWQVPASDPQRTGQHLYIHSALTNSTALPAGTTVATATSSGQAGARQIADLRVGEHTGDWAAVTVDSPAPSPWLYWVEPQGRFFGQRYRAPVPWPEGATTVTVERSPGLPDDLQLVIYAITLGHG